MNPRCTVGLDFGTRSVRALVVDTSNGRERGTATWNYKHGDQGVILSDDPHLARQHPADYLEGIEQSIRGALEDARRHDRRFDPSWVEGIGVDTTGSTPLPVDERGRPLAFQRRFARHPAAMAWLWKDHTSAAEAAEITHRARQERPEYLAKCGGTYSSEWFFSKILHCRRSAPEVFAAAHRWVECADWIPATLTGTEAPDRLKIGICAAGHKGMFHAAWGGYPDASFLGGLDPELATLRQRLPDHAATVDQAAGTLTRAWARRTGLPAGLPVAIGAFDAHLGAIGSGIAPGTLVKILGTSTCDIAVAPPGESLGDIPGVCGVVPGSVLPGCEAVEAGQSAVGDLLDWWVQRVQPGGPRAAAHAALQEAAARWRPGESGLLALDWNNGNRTVLVDPLLTGLLIGQTLHTTPAEIYRALIEATAFGALTIIERLESNGVPIRRVVNCGGLAEKSPLLLQIYADITGRPMEISRSAQTCALGSAIAGAVVAGIHPDFPTAQRLMTGTKAEVIHPRPDAQSVYAEIRPLYGRLHDAFGTPDVVANMGGVMKRLIEIRDRVRNSPTSRSKPSRSSPRSIRKKSQPLPKKRP